MVLLGLLLPLKLYIREVIEKKIVNKNWHGEAYRAVQDSEDRGR